ncbi:flagellar hook-length control protein FliK [Sinorhizobium meliloti]|uniref:flagellar hook-length control protein FliK n=1 Tax=Rhizobium meliloti TaxID=382 RepID=UPI000FD931C6|nr:flagellar hook-length control protein FliK [Sinorhizobium meliloti]MDW9365009.1 flagellar hook-length control protein FliK [Sinorhizobium meliloti]MDW9388351.1 flagellar hook-length control protein FliK [Sinorhizobium meliloti]MDW9502365.1 flagellar hook-length control protein FliK [Sinorhizobium meliloti]MDX0029020.1 flagellar hook-length control protein FliK [Sinorhizobium meliloti]MDX0072523.1 flagellar hook-length control protein FliK [Sinorhizobium meliloti]
MRPLDENLRTSAASRPAQSLSVRGQPEAESGAFGEAIADAGRRRTQGQGGQTSADDARRDSVANGGNASAVPKADGFGADVPASTADAASPDARPAYERAIITRDQAAKRLQHSHPAGTRHLSQGREDGGEEIAQPAERAVVRSRETVQTSRDSVDEASGVTAREGGENGDPASGTVSDLLSMLTGAAPAVAAASQPEGRAKPASAVRDGSDGPAKAVGGISPDVPDGEHPQTGEGTGGSEPDRLFRFARADGKGQAVSMNISRDGERAVVENSRSSVKPGVETVTVLEARRYLGLAVNENATSVTTAIAGDSGWAEALQSSAATTKPEAWSQAGKTLSTLKIQMHPVDLGMVTATLRLKDDELQVDLKVETGEAFRQLRDDQSEMVKALRAQGFAVDQVNIVFNGGGDSASGGGGQSQAQAQLGYEGRERAGDDGQGRQPRDGGRAATERWAGNDATDDVPDGAERSRAGHVYM